MRSYVCLDSSIAVFVFAWPQNLALHDCSCMCACYSAINHNLNASRDACGPKNTLAIDRLANFNHCNDKARVRKHAAPPCQVERGLPNRCQNGNSRKAEEEERQRPERNCDKDSHNLQHLSRGHIWSPDNVCMRKKLDGSISHADIR